MMKEKKEHLYVCIAPVGGEKLYDYYNGVLEEAEARRFEEHLFLCFHCQERLMKLDWVFAALREKPKAFFPPEAPKQPRSAWWQKVAAMIWPVRLTAAVAAVLLVVGLLLGAWITSLRREQQRLVGQFNEQLTEKDQAIASATESLAATRRQLEEALSRSEGDETEIAALSQTYETQISELRQTVGRLSRPQLNAPIIELDPQQDPIRREANNVQILRVPSGTNFFTLILNTVGESSYPDYGLEIANQRGQLVWRGQGLEKSSFDTFRLGLSRQWLPAGQYQIRLYGLRGERKELLEEYALRVQYQ